jgi:hypothetical protein
MSDNRAVAGQLMKEAWETISKRRPGVHGSAEQSFEMIADFWTVYLRHVRKTRGNDSLRTEDVAEMMSMLKKARKVYGDAMNIDNDVDDIGYTGLAGMLRLPDITLPKDEQVQNELDKLDVEQPVANHEHVAKEGAIIDDEGFVPCATPGCDVKVQVRKSKNGKKTDAAV